MRTRVLLAWHVQGLHEQPHGGMQDASQVVASGSPHLMCLALWEEKVPEAQHF